MEQEPSARTAFQIALVHATGYGVPRNHSMFLEWANRSSEIGLSIASLTLEIVNSDDVYNQLDLERPFNEIVVKTFRRLFNDTERIAGFSLSAELFPPQATVPEGSTSRSSKRASRQMHPSRNLSTVWEPDEVRDERKDTISSDVNTPNPHTGDTPLLAAARIGNLVAAQVLLDAGADPSIAGKDGSVPLHWLFMFPKSNHEMIGQRLGPANKAAATVNRCVTLPQKLDAQFSIELFGTPLSFAVATASLSAVEALLKLGASPTADAGIENRTLWHRSPLDIAASLHLDIIFKHLLTALRNTDPLNKIFLRLLGVLSESSIFERRCIHGAATATACRNTIKLICSYLDLLLVEPDKSADHLNAGIFSAISGADLEVATTLVEEFEAGFPRSSNIQNRAQFIREVVLFSAVKVHCANILDSSTTLDLVKFAVEKGLGIEQFNATRRAFDSQNPIFVAIMNQRDDLLKFLKESGINICAKDLQGRSAFHNIYVNNITWLSAKTMISLGFDVNERDDNSATPLHYAAMHGSPREIEELVSMSAVLNSCDDQESTPLHQAIRRRDLLVIHCLLELGADPTIFDKNGRAPIHIAAMDSQWLPVFKSLLQSGISGKMKTEDGRNCIILANDSGNRPLVEDMVTSELNSRTPQVWGPHFEKDLLVRQLLLPSMNYLSSPDGDGRAQLSYAAQNGLENMVTLLCHIIGKHSISTKDPAGRTPLSWAAVNGHTGVVKILIGLEPSVIESEDLYGCRALSLAAGNGHDETVSELLKHTIDLNIPCQNGRTALSRAAGNGHAKVVVKLLHTLQWDADSKDGLGRTPLSWAAGNGHVNVAALLFESGHCNGNLTDELARSPLSWAAGNGHLAMVGYLLSVSGSHLNVWTADVNGQSPVWWALQGSYDAVAEALLERDLNRELPGKGPTPRGPEFRNPLFEAVRRGHLAVVTFLLRTRSYHVESKDSFGRTALSFAAEAGHLDIFLQLMIVGRAKVNARDSQGRTPLYWAEKGEHLSILQELMKALTPADSNSEANDRRTPRSIAKEEGQVGVAVMPSKLNSPTEIVAIPSNSNSQKAPPSTNRPYGNFPEDEGMGGLKEQKRATSIQTTKNTTTVTKSSIDLCKYDIRYDGVSS
jgi:ankyrin repeat protein